MLTTTNHFIYRAARRHRALARAARLGAIAGMLGRFAAEPAALALAEQDFGLDLEAHEQGAADTWAVYRTAWLAAWARGRAREGITSTHLTAPAARAH